MGSNSIIHILAKNTEKEGVKKEDFKEFLSGLFPKLNQNHLILFDQAKIHKTNFTQNFLIENNCNYIFNAAYSPDYNPIELLFNVFKSNIKKTNEISILSKCKEGFRKINSGQIVGFISKLKERLDNPYYL
jgi:transposase